MSVLEGLDDQQRAAAQALRGPVVIRAGAGTGKTRVITHRIAHGVDTGAFSPSRVMALTFTAKAAGELRGRLRTMGVPGVAARTFHAAALAQLNHFWPTLTGNSAPRILDNKVRALAHAAEQVGLRTDTATLRDVAALIEARKVSLKSIQEQAAEGHKVGAWDAEMIASVQEAYEQLKDERNQIDFEDVLLACSGMIETEARVADTVREQYRFFTVDEYQDVSPLQNRLLEAWLGDRRDICVVGDASQTIYSFAGADQNYLLGFPRRYPDATVVELQTNYRSVPGVISAANALMRNRPGSVMLHSSDPTVAEVAPSVTMFSDDAEEAKGVAASIAASIASGVSPENIAVLYRVHSQSALLQEELSQAGVAWSVLGGKRFFAMAEVQQAVLALRAAAVAPSSLGFLPTVAQVLREVGLTEQPPNAASGALREGWEARKALLRLAEEAPLGASLRSFSENLMARAQDQHEPVLQTVTLSTLHAAKGLEWPHVYLVGWSEGLLPFSAATGWDAIDEERRLAYVGITRAERTALISYARGRGRVAREPSRFLAEIGSNRRGTGILRETRPGAIPVLRQNRS